MNVKCNKQGSMTSMTISYSWNFDGNGDGFHRVRVCNTKKC